MDYKRLIEDFKSGKLDKNKYYLQLDNDIIILCVNYYDEDDNEIEVDEEEYERLCEFYGRGNGYNDIGCILDAVGIPCEWC
jgi:hypothetical protein